MFFYFNRNLFNIDIGRNPHSFLLGIRIFYNKRINLNRAYENKISIKSLLDYCYFNKTGSNYIDCQYKRVIQEPIERDLEKLAEVGILTWKYEKTPTNFNEFLDSTITYTINDYDSLKEIQELKEKRLKCS